MTSRFLQTVPFWFYVRPSSTSYSNGTRCSPRSLQWALAAAFGFVSIIVREVDLDAEVLVFYCCVFAVATIGLVLAVTGRLGILARRWTLRFAIPLGTTLGIHWFLFFETIKLSSVVLAVLTAYLAPGRR
ncbi:MAG TPA: hypothetical protein VFL41_13500 [Gaiellaceae bacterium]|nr:hypothetical protein [Gaiellaceae bacterium]